MVMFLNGCYIQKAIYQIRRKAHKSIQNGIIMAMAQSQQEETMLSATQTLIKLAIEKVIL